VFDNPSLGQHDEALGRIGTMESEGYAAFTGKAEGDDEGLRRLPAHDTMAPLLVGAGFLHDAAGVSILRLTQPNAESSQ